MYRSDKRSVAGSRGSQCVTCFAFRESFEHQHAAVGVPIRANWAIPAPSARLAYRGLSGAIAALSKRVKSLVVFGLK